MKYKLSLILIFVLPLLAILLSIKLVAFDISFYKSEFRKYDVYNEVENVDGLVINLLDYFGGESELNTGYFSERERVHLRDVKNLLAFWDKVFYLLLFILLVLVVYLGYVWGYDKIIPMLFFGGLLTITLLIAIGLVVLINFEWLFTNFHLLFFVNDFWLLSSESTLIKMFPAEFFYDALLRVILYCAGFALAIILSCYIAKTLYRRRA